MSEKRIYAVSLEDVMVPVSAVKNGVAYDPTADVVEMAFVTFDSSDPAPADWKPAAWEAGQGGTHLARCLVGPGGAVTLARGRYRVFVRVTDSPEIPVKASPTVLVVI